MRKNKANAKDTAKYKDEPVQLGQRVPDFLPSPEELAEAEETVKVTIALSRPSVEFFKQAAAETHSSYQKMIRRLLDEYVQRQQDVKSRTHS